MGKSGGSRLGLPLPTMIQCSCGKTLRAKPEFAGGEIVCWNCHAKVQVPIHVAPGGWVARLLRMGARQIFEARTITLLVIGAIMLTLSLRVPKYGVWTAAVALALVMIGYGELFRRGSQGDWTRRPRVGLLMRGWRVFICLASATGLALPLIVAWGYGNEPRVNLAGVLIGGGLCLVIPLVMLGTYAPTGSINQRVKMIGEMVFRHPFASVFALLIFPVTLIAVEFCVYEVIRWNEWFRFFVIDLFPLPEGAERHLSRIFINTVDFLSVDMKDYDRFFASALSQGYTLTGSIAASLVLPISNGLDPGTVFGSARQYLWVRMLFTLFTVTCMLSALAVQARWLGLLLTVDTRRTAAEAAASSSSSGTGLQPMILNTEQGQTA